MAINQIKSNQNHFYCHITTAQVPWWVKFLWACSRQCRKTTDNLHRTDSPKKQQTIYIWTDSAKNNKQFTYGQTVQKTALEHLQCSRQCKKKQQQQFTYRQTVQKKQQQQFTYRQTVQKKQQQQFTYGQTVQKKNNSNLHMDSTYLQTVQKTCANTHTCTQYA